MEVLFYKRPRYIKPSGKALDHSECERYLGRTDAFKDRIPADLTFENVIANKAIPPCSLQDFMEFLRYIEHDAENLQFYFWLQDYTTRFSNLSSSEKALSPEWIPEQAPPLPGTNIKSMTKTAANVHVNFDEPQNPFADQSNDEVDTASFVATTIKSTKTNAEAAGEAQAQAGLKWQPFTIQPFREEITKVIAHYIAPGSPRELNLSHRDRAHVLHALQHTSHPSAFARVKDIVDTTLRRQSHPNFIRYSICNSNMPRVMFARISGFMTLLTGILTALLIGLTYAPRWYRILTAPLMFVGGSILIASFKGLCLILQVIHSHNVKPWNAYADDEASIFSNHTKAPPDDEITLTQIAPNGGRPNSITKEQAARHSTDTFGSSNSFSDEPWIQRYKKQNIVRKVFDKQVWIQNDQIRFMQDRIALQSYAWSFALTVVLTAGLTAIPNANKF
ncbi:MAG: hypothetical protein M4579_005629 [Chaenotheca gracillima]|nr:MAG: hypothetical protein M4579_005629 [Chaenotheca gracillima]